jgi:hypothetical protein
MIREAFCIAMKLDVLRGLHQPDDDYRMALYTDAAILDETTSRYSSAGEAVGQGYEAGGRPLTGIQYGLEDGDAFMVWEDAVWPVATIEADGALVYNASRDDRAIVVREFGRRVKSINGPFTVFRPQAWLVAHEE